MTTRPAGQTKLMIVSSAERCSAWTPPYFGSPSAAKTLRITQPALSRQLKDLKAEFGVSLFDQVGRRLRSTTEGAELVSLCRTLLQQADTVLDYARLRAKGDTGELRIGAPPHTIASVFPSLLRQFVDRGCRALERRASATAVRRSIQRSVGCARASGDGAIWGRGWQPAYNAKASELNAQKANYHLRGKRRVAYTGGLIVPKG